MKFWQKLYLMTLVLFPSVFTFSMLILVRTLYEDNLKTEKNKGLQEAEWLAEHLWEDFESMARGTTAERGITERTISNLMTSYTYDYVLKNGLFSLYRGEELLYTNMSFEDFALVPENVVEYVQARVYWLEDDCYYCISVPIKGYSGYSLLYFHEIVGVRAFMAELTRLCLTIGTVGTFFLAVLLYFLVKKMTKPLGSLEHAAEEIASGQYATRVPVKGEDEFASVAESFNGMAGEVQHHVDSLEKENQSKQLFIDNLAHEMNTPLTSIRGYGEYLQRSGSLLSEEERFEALDYIVKEAGRMSGMGKQLLLLADLREGEFSFESISVSDLFTALRKMFVARSHETDVEIMFSSNVENVTGDAALLESLIANLIENGIRACERGGRVEVDLKGLQNNSGVDSEKADAGNGWILRVRDNGRGIPEESIPFILEPFYRTDKARSRANGGAGLGLTLCRQIAELHHGTIDLVSKVGEGTEFIITFTTL